MTTDTATRHTLTFSADPDTGDLPSVTISRYTSDGFVVCLSDGVEFGDLACVALTAQDLHDLQVLITTALDNA